MSIASILIFGPVSMVIFTLLGLALWRDLKLSLVYAATMTAFLLAVAWVAVTVVMAVSK